MIVAINCGISNLDNLDFVFDSLDEHVKYSV